MAPKQAKMTGPELAGVVVAVQGYVMVLVEAMLDRDGVSEEDAQAVLRKMNETGKQLAREIGHTEVVVYGESYANDMMETISKNLKRLRDGKPG